MNRQSTRILTSTNVVVVAVAPDILGGVSSIVDDVYRRVLGHMKLRRELVLLTATNVVVVAVAPDVLSGVRDSLGLICLGRST